MEGKPARKRKRPPAAPRAKIGALEAKLPLGRALRVERGRDGALVSIREPAGRVELEFEIAVTKDGPRVRVRAAALEIEAAERLTARCKEFHVEAGRGTLSVEETVALGWRVGDALQALHAVGVVYRDITCRRRSRPGVGELRA
jgi:hypothetical protein